MIVCISLNVQGLENLTMSESKTDQLKAAFLLFCKRATGSRTLPYSHKSNTDKNKNKSVMRIRIHLPNLDRIRPFICTDRFPQQFMVKKSLSLFFC